MGGSFCKTVNNNSICWDIDYKRDFLGYNLIVYITGLNVNIIYAKMETGVIC